MEDEVKRRKSRLRVREEIRFSAHMPILGEKRGWGEFFQIVRRANKERGLESRSFS
jgi:hypothetical protein